VKARIHKRAIELGFDLCRIAPAAKPVHAAEFSRWLDANRHGDMAYLKRTSEKRTDPQFVLADAKSIIALGVSYATLEPQGQPEEQTPAGAVARYATFQDYHDVIGGNLKKLADYTIELGGAQTRSLGYVDTGPILERDVAQRSGLGFIGKHTNLISRQFGNWIFLAEIITTLDLEPDVPEINRCGSCTKCLSACPTNAFVAPFELDARRCISYLTIELKGSIPVELRQAIGNRIFGCDDCLAVCPWNRFAREGRMMRDYRLSDFRTPNLVELLNLDAAEFKKRFSGTPIVRTKRRGLLRNVAVALGNSGDTAALPALEKATSDVEPLVAEHAAWAIQQIEARRK